MPQTITGIRWLYTITDFRLRNAATFTAAVANKRLGESFNVTYLGEDEREHCVTVRLVYVHTSKAVVQEYFGDMPQGIFFVLHHVGTTWEGSGYAVSLCAIQTTGEIALYNSLVSR